MLRDCWDEHGESWRATRRERERLSERHTERQREKWLCMHTRIEIHSLALIENENETTLLLLQLWNGTLRCLKWKWIGGVVQLGLDLFISVFAYARTRTRSRSRSAIRVIKVPLLANVVQMQLRLGGRVEISTSYY